MNAWQFPISGLLAGNDGYVGEMAFGEIRKAFEVVPQPAASPLP